MNVLGISGSLRSGSYNTQLLRTAAELAPSGVHLELWEGLGEIPPYDADDDVEPAPAAVARMRATVARADAVLVATPEYNSSVPGQLKNALDWLSRPLQTNPLRNKPVAVVGSSTGMFGAVWAQAELRKVLAAIGARVVEAELPVGRAATVFAEGRLVDGELRARLAEIVEQLADEVQASDEARAEAAHGPTARALHAAVASA
jgi:chromate reductase